MIRGGRVSFRHGDDCSSSSSKSKRHRQRTTVERSFETQLSVMPVLRSALGPLTFSGEIIHLAHHLAYTYGRHVSSSLLKQLLLTAKAGDREQPARTTAGITRRDRRDRVVSRITRCEVCLAKTSSSRPRAFTIIDPKDSWVIANQIFI